jgi:hypothetical protein
MALFRPILVFTIFTFTKVVVDDNEFDKLSWHHLLTLANGSFFACCFLLALVDQVTTTLVFVIGPNVTMSTTDFSFQNLVFWNLFEFSVAKIT